MKGRDITRGSADEHGDKLKRVSQADRKRMALSTTLNRFWRRREELRAQSRVGPGSCRHCGSEPCGGGWGPLPSEQSARCCGHCTHPSVPDFSLTHILWHDKKAFFVREVPVGNGGAVYQRADGVVWFVRIFDQYWFLGRPLGTADLARFRIHDRNGWPQGLEAKDMGIDISKDVDRELRDGALEEFDDEAPEDMEESDEEDDDDDSGEDGDDGEGGEDGVDEGEEEEDEEGGDADDDAEDDEEEDDDDD